LGQARSTQRRTLVVRDDEDALTQAILDLASDMLAIAPEFGLRIFQQHSGPDFQRFTQNGGTSESH